MTELYIQLKKCKIFRIIKYFLFPAPSYQEHIQFGTDR